MNKPKWWLALPLFGLLLASDIASSGKTDNACLEGPMAQFGRYVGDWKITDEALARDGSGWGTNVRTYNPDTESWEIVWASTGLNGLMHISAKLQEDGSILKPEQNPPRRIIFFPPDDEGWSWQQEWWFENSQAWTPVYKIRATPWNDGAS